MKVSQLKDEKRAALRMMKKMLKKRLSNGFYTWAEVNAKAAIKCMEQEIKNMP